MTQACPALAQPRPAGPADARAQRPEPKRVRHHRPRGIRRRGGTATGPRVRAAPSRKPEPYRPPRQAPEPADMTPASRRGRHRGPERRAVLQAGRRTGPRTGHRTAVRPERPERARAAGQFRAAEPGRVEPRIPRRRRHRPPCWNGWVCGAKATCGRAPGPRASGPMTCSMPCCKRSGEPARNERTRLRYRSRPGP